MSSSRGRSSYSAFSEVDDLVSKPVLGSDGAASWQEFKDAQKKRPPKAGGAAAPSAGSAPGLPVKRSDRLGTGLATIDEERRREEEVRREAGDEPRGSGYTEFKRRGPDAEEAAARKRARLILDRVRPDGAAYFVRAETFDGWREDYVFTTRDRGTGYYWDGMDSARRQMGLSPAGGSAAPADPAAAGEDGTAEKNKTKKKKKKKQRKAGEAGEEADAAAHPEVGSGNSPMEQVAAAMRRMQENRSRPPGAPAAAAARPAAPGWEAAADPSTGRTYYYHRGSGERRWDPPIADGASGAPAASAASGGGGAPSKVEGGGAAAGGGAAEGRGGGELPGGWKSVVDGGSGRAYYYHARSGKTSWERPTA